MRMPDVPQWQTVAVGPWLMMQAARELSLGRTASCAHDLRSWNARNGAPLIKPATPPRKATGALGDAYGSSRYSGQHSATAAGVEAALSAHRRARSQPPPRLLMRWPHPQSVPQLRLPRATPTAEQYARQIEQQTRVPGGRTKGIHQRSISLHLEGEDGKEAGVPFEATLVDSPGWGDMLSLPRSFRVVRRPSAFEPGSAARLYWREYLDASLGLLLSAQSSRRLCSRRRQAQPLGRRLAAELG